MNEKLTYKQNMQDWRWRLQVCAHSSPITQNNMSKEMNLTFHAWQCIDLENRSICNDLAINFILNKNNKK